MPQSVVIARSAASTLGSFEGVCRSLALDSGVGCSVFHDQIQLCSADLSLKLVVSELGDRELVAEDYSANNDLNEQFRVAAAGFRYYLVVFGDVEIARSFLCRVAGEAVGVGEAAWFDTDYGWVVSAEDFLDHLKQRSDWDWRTVGVGGV